MIGEQNFFDLVARFVALSIVYRNDLMQQWPSPVTEEWLDVLNTLEDECTRMDDTGQE